MNGDERRFFNPTQPQTLQIGVALLYINGVLLLLGGAVLNLLGLALIAGLAAGGYGIANEKRWGYQVGVAAAIVNLGLPLLIWGIDDVFSNFGLMLSLLFDVALVALLVHPQSREYQKIWFR